MDFDKCHICFKNIIPPETLEVHHNENHSTESYIENPSQINDLLEDDSDILSCLLENNSSNNSDGNQDNVDSLTNELQAFILEYDHSNDIFERYNRIIMENALNPDDPSNSNNMSKDQAIIQLLVKEINEEASYINSNRPLPDTLQPSVILPQIPPSENGWTPNSNAIIEDINLDDANYSVDINDIPSPAPSVLDELLNEFNEESVIRSAGVSNNINIEQVDDNACHQDVFLDLQNGCPSVNNVKGLPRTFNDVLSMQTVNDNNIDNFSSSNQDNLFGDSDSQQLIINQRIQKFIDLLDSMIASNENSSSNTNQLTINYTIEHVIIGYPLLNIFSIDPNSSPIIKTLKTQAKMSPEDGLDGEAFLNKTRRTYNLRKRPNNTGTTVKKCCAETVTSGSKNTNRRQKQKLPPKSMKASKNELPKPQDKSSAHQSGMKPRDMERQCDDTAQRNKKEDLKHQPQNMSVGNKNHKACCYCKIYIAPNFEKIHFQEMHNSTARPKIMEPGVCIICYLKSRKWITHSILYQNNNKPNKQDPAKDKPKRVLLMCEKCLKGWENRYNGYKLLPLKGKRVIKCCNCEINPATKYVYGKIKIIMREKHLKFIIKRFKITKK